MLRVFGYPVATRLGVVGSNLTISNLSQQHPTCRNTVAKRTQHVAPNNVGIYCIVLARAQRVCAHPQIYVFVENLPIITTTPHSW